MLNKYRPTSEDYEDHVLYGPSYERTEYIRSLKAHNDPDCIIFGANTFADSREQWKLKDLIGYDKRLVAMLKEKGYSTDENRCITYAVPMQRYCWPKMHNNSFPLLCIAPQGAGKTYAHLLYSVALSIKRVPMHETDRLLKDEAGYIYEANTDTDLNDLRNYPRCLIITSTHDQAEQLVRIVDQFKMNAFELPPSDHGRLRFMPPVVRSVNVDQQDDKLVLRCHESEILVGTPAAMVKCLELRAINFAQADRIVFDSIDLSLQLWNYKIQELIGIYASQTESMPHRREKAAHAIDNRLSKDKIKTRQAQMLMFSRKWTKLLKKFMATVFPQRTIIFGSIVEASVYLNIRFESESYKNQAERVEKLTNLVNSLLFQRSKEFDQSMKFVIVCGNECEAQELKAELSGRIDHPVKLIDQEQLSHQTVYSSWQSSHPIVIITDSAIDFEVEFSSSRQSMNDITHLIHYSVPHDMIEFDQRFRLMHKKIREGASGLLSTIFIGPNFTSLQAKQLYDLFSRSTATLHGTKSDLRDRMNNQFSSLCWRWATIGICRFEKLSRDDAFGSYCPERHSLLPRDKSPLNRWPTEGQLKITPTHIISPNEFYFWFEAHRDINNRSWTKLESTGKDFMKNMQLKLDKLKAVPPRSVPIANIRKGNIYAVYFQQLSRVDRVLLLDEPKHEIERSVTGDRLAVSTSMSRINPAKEYRRLIPVFKIDYGSRLEVYVENIIQLPLELAKIEPMAHRGFNIGLEPTSNEPNWHYRTKRLFYEKVTVQNIRHITVWLRLNRDDCFWFDNMTISRQLANIDSTDILDVQPHRELIQSGMAVASRSEPKFLPPSMRLLTLGRWNSLKLSECAQNAFLRKDKAISDIFLLNVTNSLDVIVRQSEFNKCLIQLEDQLIEDYQLKRLSKQQHFDKDVYCLARILEGHDPETKLPIYTINRVRIIEIKRDSRVLPNKNLDDPEDGDQIDPKGYIVECLDHGDWFALSRDDLYQAPIKYFSTLPFQAIKCTLANVNPKIREDRSLSMRTRECMIDSSRTKSNQNKILKSRFDSNGDLYLYTTKDDDDNTYYPMSTILGEKGIQFHETTNAEYERVILPHIEVERNEPDTNRSRLLITEAIKSILNDMIRQELLAAGADPIFIEKKTAEDTDLDL